MSVKKEPSGRRSVEVEVEVPGTPEEVWDAIATGPGISSWFVPTELEERAGGTMKLSFGPGMDLLAAVTAWEPPRRLAAQSPPQAPGSPPMATEWIVEARGGGSCVVRVVHSLFAATDEWDDQLTGPESGWPSFFRVLRLYLERFRGRHGVGFQVVAPATGSVDEAWRRLRDELRAGAPPLSGEPVDRGAPHELLLVVDTPGAGIARFDAGTMGGAAMVMVAAYFYGDAAAEIVAREAPRWQAWFAATFPPG